MSPIGSTKIDSEQMQAWLESPYDTESVASFKAGPGIQKLQLKFDIDKYSNQMILVSITLTPNTIDEEVGE